MRTAIVVALLSLTPAVAAGPELEVSAGSLQFEWQTGKPLPASKRLRVSADRPDTLFEVVVSAASRHHAWLSVSPDSARTPSDLRIEALPAGLEPGRYDGEIQIRANGAGPLRVQVRLIVVDKPLLTAVPPVVDIVWRPGTPLPQPQTVRIDSEDPDLGFAAHPLPGPGGEWFGVEAVAAKTPGAVTIFLKPRARSLGPGVYSGEVLLTTGAAVGLGRAIPVRFTVTRQRPLSPNVSNLSFVYDTKGSHNPPLTSIVRVDNGAAGFATAIEAESDAGWLMVRPLDPLDLEVSVRPDSLAPGKYDASIVLTPLTPNQEPARIPVRLTVTSQPAVQANPKPVRFSVKAGDRDVQSQSIQVSSTSDTVSYDVDFARNGAGLWLSVANLVGRTPGEIRVDVDPSRLSPGTYSGTVVISVRGGNSETVPVMVTAR